MTIVGIIGRWSRGIFRSHLHVDDVPDSGLTFLTALPVPKLARKNAVWRRELQYLFRA